LSLPTVTTQLPDEFNDMIHAADVCLGEQSTVRINRQIAAESDPPIGNEVATLALRAKTQVFELAEHNVSKAVINQRQYRHA
jgi:hypothetical protein